MKQTFSIYTVGRWEGSRFIKLFTTPERDEAEKQKAVYELTKKGRWGIKEYRRQKTTRADVSNLVTASDEVPYKSGKDNEPDRVTIADIPQTLNAERVTFEQSSNLDILTHFVWEGRAEDLSDRISNNAEIKETINRFTYYTEKNTAPDIQNELLTLALEIACAYRDAAYCTGYRDATKLLFNILK